MRIVTSALAVAALVASPAAAHGQSILDLLQSIRDGGGWVYIDVEGGRGTWVSHALPTLELTLAGCMQVYAGQSGRWDIRARDALGDGTLEARVTGGERVPFRYRTGARSQLVVEARWSEARDTTLVVWVGLETPGQQRDVCEPIYGTDVDDDADPVPRP
ncbi:MAG TPA: hypothetical protein VJ997_15750 [Longimicrobiales bacterium]|nr:hypothetical protein [Longimicrobiales bacterium]